MKPLKFKKTGYTIADGATQGMLLDFGACRKRMKFILDGWETKRTKAALRRGSITHDALRDYYEAIRTGKRGDLSPVLIKALDRQIAKQLQAASNAKTTEEIEVDAMKLEAVLRVYPQHWDEDQTRDWVQVESVFDVNFRGFRLRGRQDGLFKKKRDFRLLETKTTSRVNEDMLSTKLSFDFQCLLYLTALRHMPDVIPDPKRLKGVLYNVIHLPQLKQRKGEDSNAFRKRMTDDVVARPDFYFRRFELTFPEEMYATFEDELEMKLKEFKAWLDGDPQFPTFKRENSCFSFWPCEYTDACASESMVGYARTRVLFRELLDEEGESDGGQKGRAQEKEKGQAKAKRRVGRKRKA